MEYSEFLDTINSIISSLEGKSLREDSRIVDSRIDSLSYYYFWLALEEKYPVLDKKTVLSLNYVTLTVYELFCLVSKRMSDGNY